MLSSGSGVFENEMTHKERNPSLIRRKDTAQQQLYLLALQVTVSDIYSYGIIESRITRILLFPFG